jgi:hypothetical protein
MNTDEILKAATPRPWGDVPEDVMAGHYQPARVFGAYDTSKPKIVCELAARPNWDANAELIVLAVNAYEGDRALIGKLVEAAGNLPCTGGGCGHPLYLHVFAGGCQGVQTDDVCGCVGGSPEEDAVIAALTAAKERTK